MSNEIHSDLINEISSALAKAQSEIRFAEKDGENPHYKSAFASLGSHLEVCKEVLGKNGLMVTQLSTFLDGKHVLVTILSHSSGQWFKSYYPLNPVKNDPQGMGSCLTYARRYMLSAIVGTAAQDDDGNEACKDDQKKRDYYVNKTKQADTILSQERPDTTLIENITENQRNELLTLVAQTDQDFIDKFYPNLSSKGIPDISSIPVDRYFPICQWVKTNIDRINNTSTKGN